MITALSGAFTFSIPVSAQTTGNAPAKPAQMTKKAKGNPAATSAVKPTKQESNLDKLANLRFLGNVQFKYNDELVYAYHPQQGQVGAPYPWHFFISPKSRIPGGTIVTDRDTAFGLSVGSYTGGVKGYWVRYPALPVIRLAWQALPPRNSGSCRLSFWNEDQQARGNPEDDEMFYFEIVDPAKSTVKIKSRYCKYLHLDGDTFNPGAEATEAAVFTVVFLDPSFVRSPNHSALAR
jgi:hypothetical protein